MKLALHPESALCAIRSKQCRRVRFHALCSAYSNNHICGFTGVSPFHHCVLFAVINAHVEEKLVQLPQSFLREPSSRARYVASFASLQGRTFTAVGAKLFLGFWRYVLPFFFSSLPTDRWFCGCGAHITGSSRHALAMSGCSENEHSVKAVIA